MALLDEVTTAIADAMRARDQTRLTALRMLKTALTLRRVDKGRELEPAEALAVVAMLVKQRRDSIEQFSKGGRGDLADKEAAEIRVLESYLPPAVDGSEIERAVDAAIAETGAAGPKDLGRVMKSAMAYLTGRGADGKIVNEIARKKLGGSQ